LVIVFEIQKVSGPLERYGDNYCNYFLDPTDLIFQDKELF